MHSTSSSLTTPLMMPRKVTADVQATRDGSSRATHDCRTTATCLPLIPGERIVLHWQFVGPDRMTDPAMTTLLTVTFTPIPSGTRLDLTHDRLDNLREQFPYIAEQVRPGWESALDALVAGTW